MRSAACPELRRGVVVATMSLVSLIGLLVAFPAQADPLRVLPEGKLPNDRRLEAPKDLNGYFPFEVPESKEAWEARAAQLRRRVLVATGLWPMPEKTPLNPVIHGRVERDGFTVEKVYFESLPNHFVTGLLFRPKNAEGKRPVVLCPHGHGGRQQDHGAKKIRQLLVEGQERFEDCGRYPKLSRCAQLARMGCIVFIFDMLGYADSVQLSRKLAHGFAKQRPDFEGKDNWGLFSTQAELRLQSVMGLQTWNSVRALDFLCGLPDADPARVGVTGGSGGGTQTILLGAIDPRPVVAFPQGMVSTSMQGGCTCENCCLLRVGTGNVELTALFAPKPQGMTAANDWTKEMMTKGYPELERLYTMLGAKDRVFCKSTVHFPHNYNYVTRAMMYSLFNKHLKLGLDEPIVEEHWQPLTAEESTVWNDEHPKPEGGPDYERSLCKWLAQQSDKQIAALQPTDAESLAEYRTVVGKAFETIIGRTVPPTGRFTGGAVTEQDCGEFVLCKHIYHDEEVGSELPVILLEPKNKSADRRVVMWMSGRGKAGMFAEDGRPCAAVGRLLKAGIPVFSADLFLQGEFLPDGDILTETPVVSNPREFAGYTFGYNYTVFARRVRDIVSLHVFAITSQHQGAGSGHPKVYLVGLEGAGPLAAAARTVAGTTFAKAAIDTGGFRFEDLKSYRDPNFLPGAVKYGDLPALMALSAPRPLWIAGEAGKTPAVTAAAYEAAGHRDAVQSFAGEQDDVAQAAVTWLLGE